MAAMDLTTINNIWAPVYGKLQRALRILTPEWSQLKSLRNFDQLSPRAINWPVEMFYGGGMAFTGDGGSTAEARSNEPVEATDTWKHLVGRFEVGFDSMVGENNSKFSAQQIEKQMRYQAADKAKAFKRAIAIHFYGHNTGTLFRVSSANDGADTLVVKDLYGVAGMAVPTRIRDYITAGLDKVAIINPSGNVERLRVMVDSITESSDTLAFAAGTDLSAVAANDLIALANQAITGEGSDHLNAINGLLDITRGATLHGLASATYPDWVAGIDVSSLGAALSGKQLYEWFEEVDQRSGHPIEWLYTTIGAIAEAGGTELDQRRYGADEDTMRLGFSKLNVMGVLAQSRPYVPAGYGFMGSSGALRKLSPDEDVRDVITTGDRSGGFKQYENRLGFYKDQVFRSNLTAISRLGLGVVDGITEA